MTLRTLYLVMRSHQLVHGRMEAVLKAFDLTPAQYAVLSRLEAGGVSAAEIARTAQVSAQAVTQWIHQLDAKGLISRSVDPKNRRLLRIRLTRKGPPPAGRLRRGRGRVGEGTAGRPVGG
ncbi:MAG: MarR family transcriptional regulator [Caulobacteraceae bacterium]